MKTGKITAKLRDAVKIHIVEEGHPECPRIYKNIELPDMLKDIEYKDFEFLIMGEKIEFEITYEKGSLPAKLPGERPKITREEKRAAKVLAEARAMQDKAMADNAAKARPFPSALAESPAPVAPKTDSKPAAPAPNADAKPAAPAPKADAKPATPAPKADAKPATPAPKADAKPATPAPKADAKPAAPKADPAKDAGTKKAQGIVKK